METNQKERLTLPRLSLVVPFFNEEQHIANCLDSIIKQTILPDELILVNNNSTDMSDDLVTNFIAKNSHKLKIIYLTELEQGIVPARNKGFTNATCELVARTDADTRIDTDWVEVSKKTFANTNMKTIDRDTLVGISTIPEFYDINRVTIKKIYQFCMNQFFEICNVICGTDVLLGSTMVIRKDALDLIFESLSKDTETGHEDIELSLKLTTVGKIKLIPALKAQISARRFRNPNNILYYFYKQIKTFHNDADILTQNFTFKKSQQYSRLKDKIKEYLTIT